MKLMFKFSATFKIPGAICPIVNALEDTALLIGRFEANGLGILI